MNSIRIVSVQCANIPRLSFEWHIFALIRSGNAKNESFNFDLIAAEAKTTNIDLIFAKCECECELVNV